MGILAGMSDDGSAPKRVPGVKGVDPFGAAARAKSHEARKFNIQKKAAESRAVSLLTGDSGESLAGGAQAALQVLILRIVNGEQQISSGHVAPVLVALHDIVRLENDRPTSISATLSADVNQLEARMSALAEIAQGYTPPIHKVVELEAKGVLPPGSTAFTVEPIQVADAEVE